MVQRNSEATPVPVAQSPRITTQALGQVAARSAAGAFSTNVATAQVAPVGTYLQQDNTLLSNALGKLSDSLGQIAETQRRRAYVDGSVAAVVGQSREAIEASPLTRAWANAGFNDTKGNLALADYQAQALNDMPKLREQGPEAMQQHILKQRNTVVPALESMSTEAKIKAYESLATTDTSLINKHYVEHGKFITEQKVKGIETQLNVALSAIESSQGDPSYEASLESAYTTLVSTVVAAEDLPQEVKDSMVVDFLIAAMAQGDLGMYEYARARPLIDDGQGGTLALTRLLSMEAQVKLANEYDKYQRRWAFINDQDTFRQLLEVELSLERGEDVPVEVQRQLLQRAVNTRAITNEGANSKFLKWARQSKSVQDSKDLALAYVNGDITTLARSGKSNYEIAKSVESILAPNGSATELFMLHLDTGLRTGGGGALQRAGELLKPTINAALTADVNSQIDPSHTELFEYYVNVESQARNNGLSNFRSNVLSLLSDDQKVFFNNIISRVQSGNSDVVTAIQEARDDHHRWGSLSQSAKAALVREDRTRVTNMIDSILGGDTNILNIPRAFHKVLNAVGIQTNEGMADSVRARGFGFGGYNATANNQYRTNMNILLHNASENLLQRGAFRGMGDSDAKELLLSEAIKHVVPIPYGSSTTNMILPLGSNLGTLFGFADGNVSYGSEELGRAIGSIIDEGRDKDAHPLVQYANGVVTVSMFKGEDVYPASVFQLSVEDIQDKAREIRRLGSIEEVRVYGTGHTVKGKDGSAVTFNGENTANVHPEVMFRIRESLVKFEDVTKRAYADGSGGKKSIGVGINTGNPTFYPQVNADGTVSNEEISKSFAKVSDYFVSKANSYASKYGALVNDNENNGLEFLTHLMYQTGESKVWHEHSPALLKAMANKPVDGVDYLKAYQEALKAFRKFPASKQSFSGRRVAFYETLLINYFGDR